MRTFSSAFWPFPGDSEELKAIYPDEFSWIGRTKLAITL